MTLIVGWIACDSKKGGHKPSALYFGSDSRISWGCSHVYDYGKKLFASRKHPEIFAFCGDVTFANISLQPLLELIDSGTFILPENAEVKSKLIGDHLQSIISKYADTSNANQTIILYGTKVGSHFFVYKYMFMNHSVICKNIDINHYSSIIAVEGSGTKTFANHINLPMQHKDLYSREICHYIAETIDASEEFTIGGIPQIVGIYRGLETPRVFGFVKDGKSYLYGREVNAAYCEEYIEWRNIDFERIDPETLQLIEGAQAQPFLR